MPWSSTVMTEMWLLRLRLFVINFLSPRLFVSFFSTWRGAPRIDLPLFMFSLAISVLVSLFSKLTLLAGETNTIVLEEAILGEEKSYPKSVLLETAFGKLSISSSFALEVLSNWALTCNSSASSFFVFSARTLISDRKALMVWFASSTLVESSSWSSLT